ncbi:hypothetical protein FC976_00325 [Clostridium sporogenes]|uniref:P-loop NTPase fold protein n=1 Tax=Clostridium sporogenes TaxID=1509 RepID=UPI0013D77696|nr:P-loop NTPase fold protein [Clostridium sporogenes]NFH45697.1 hypothetical protein [Clostridium sporogenes]
MVNMLEEIKKFCAQKNTTGALLITGQWGCGKSYFIDHELIENEEIKEKFAIIKISLFGINTSEQFNQALKKEYLKVRYGSFLKEETQDRVAKGTEIIKKAISTFVPSSDVILSADWSVFLSIEKFDNKEIVLIFDDLERCGLEADIVLGLLNEYVETHKLKTIIIANEENMFMNKQKKDLQNEIYINMKEKIISRTIKLLPNYYSIIKNIINTYCETESGYKDFLDNNLDYMIMVFLESEKNNIRSLKCAIQDFERFFNKLSSYISDNEILYCMLYNFIAMVFEYKSGNILSERPQKTTNKNNDDILHNITYDYESKKKYNKYKNFNSKYTMKAMENWIVNGEWDEELLENELKKIVTSLEKSKPKEILLNYTNLTFVDDETLQAGFAPLLEDAYNGTLLLNDYIAIFKMIICAKYYKITLPCNIDYGKLKTGVEKRMTELTSGIVKESLKYQTYIIDENLSYLSSEEVAIVKSIDTFREEFIYTSKRPQIVEALKTNNHRLVNQMIEKYTGAFDEKYARVIGEYYVNLKNQDKTSFISILISSWTDTQTYSEKNIDTSINGLAILQKLIKPTVDDGKISTALDKFFSEEIAKKLQFYKEKKNEYNKEKNNFYN